MVLMSSMKMAVMSDVGARSCAMLLMTMVMMMATTMTKFTILKMIAVMLLKLLAGDDVDGDVIMVREEEDGYDDGDEDDCDGHGDLDSDGDDGFVMLLMTVLVLGLVILLMTVAVMILMLLMQATAACGFCGDDGVNRECADVGCYRIDDYRSWKSVSKRRDKFPSDIQSSNTSHSGLGCCGSVAVGLGYLLLGGSGVQGHPNYSMKLQPFTPRHTHTLVRAHTHRGTRTRAHTHTHAVLFYPHLLNLKSLEKPA